MDYPQNNEESDIQVTFTGFQQTHDQQDLWLKISRNSHSLSTPRTFKNYIIHYFKKIANIGSNRVIKIGC